MPLYDSFALFMEDEKGPLWRGFFSDLASAKNTAQKLADKEGFQFFVFSFHNFSEAARAFPAHRRRSA